MPYPTPPAPRIAYDDPSIASVFWDRSAIADDTKNDNIWTDARIEGVRAMNVGDGFGVAFSHDPYQQYYSPVPPYDAIINAADNNGFTMEIVFQVPYTIKGIEFNMAYLASSGNLQQKNDIRMYSIPEGKDPFGIDTISHGILTLPSHFNAASFYPSPMIALNPQSLMREFPTVPNDANGPRYFQIHLDSPKTVHSLDILNTVALRFQCYPPRVGYPGGSGPTPAMINLALYGYPSDNPRLGFVSPTSSTILEAEELTFGDAALGSSEDLQFRVKNYHQTETANDIILSAEGNYIASPTPQTQLLFSSDGMNFFSTLTLPSNLPPGATSFIITVRKVTPVTSPQGQRHPRIRADVGSWT
jgi:hypothetical protein